jgi:hypothetical protein
MVWLGDVQPAWIRLDPESVDTLLQVRDLGDPPSTVSADLDLEELAASPVLVHARLVLRNLAESHGVKLTATGNLNRKFVGQMLDAFRWPGLSSEEVYAVNKVVNETDFMPLHFLRLILQQARLIRRQKGMLRISRTGAALLDDRAAGELMRNLIITTFGRFNLAYLDRTPLDRFPQDQTAIVLCLLRVVAEEWMVPGILVRKTALPTAEVLEAVHDDFPDFAFEGRVLRPLHWFGLMERRHVNPSDRFGPREYRLTPLYDRLLSFDIPQSLGARASGLVIRDADIRLPAPLFPGPR